VRHFSNTYSTRILAKPPAWQLCSSYTPLLVHIPGPGRDYTSDVSRCGYVAKRLLPCGNTGRQTAVDIASNDKAFIARGANGSFGSIADTPLASAAERESGHPRSLAFAGALKVFTRASRALEMSKACRYQRPQWAITGRGHRPRDLQNPPLGSRCRVPSRSRYKLSLRCSGIPATSGDKLRSERQHTHGGRAIH
jgi:hypothetical protein